MSTILNNQYLLTSFRFITTFLIIATSCQTGYAQFNSSNIESGELKVGDQFPNYTSEHVLNYPSKSLSLDHFKGKLIILDLWSTSCTGCVLSWPKLISLQQKFKDRIQIVLINPWEQKTRIQDMFAKRKKMANVDMTLPSVYGDTTILKFFPIQTVPHIVWIDEKFTIRSISHGTELNEKNIKAALDRNNYKMRQKLIEFGRPYDASKPLYVNGNGGDSPAINWQSILTGPDETLWSGKSVCGTDSASFCVGTNVSVSQLYQMAYGREKSPGEFPPGCSGWLPPNRLIFEVSNPSQYLYEVDEQLNYDNFVTYSLVGPPMSADSIQKYMQEDLRRYFPLEAKWEQRKTLCYVWKCSDTSAIAYKSGKQEHFIYTQNFTANKIPMTDVFWYLNFATAWGEYVNPIVDETGLRGLLGGIREEGDVLSPKELARMLAKYKITITLEERTIPFLVVRERKSTFGVSKPHKVNPTKKG